MTIIPYVSKMNLDRSPDELNKVLGAHTCIKRQLLRFVSTVYECLLDDSL